MQEFLMPIRRGELRDLISPKPRLISDADEVDFVCGAIWGMIPPHARIT